MQVRYLGIVDYQNTWESMKSFSSQRTVATEDELWLCQHPPIFTLGTKASRQNILRTTSIPIIQTDRGGEVTYHGPGQLMIYPLVDLRKSLLYPKDFLHQIQTCVCRVLEHFQITPVLVDSAPGIYTPLAGGTGLFQGLAKIASVGLKISNHSAYHGISLNVDADLTNFQFINPCGYGGLRMTSLKELGVVSDILEVAKVTADTFVSNFQ